MSEFNRRTVVLGMAAGLLAGCQLRDPAPSYPVLTFVRRAPIKLNVAEVAWFDEFVMSGTAPNVEHLAPIAPGPVATRWARDVLQAGGTSGKAHFSVNDASIVESKLKKQGGLKGVFTNDQDRRFDVSIAGTLVIYSPTGKRLGTAEASATRFATLAERASLQDRDALLYALVEKTSLDFADAIEGAIRSKLTAHIL